MSEDQKYFYTGELWAEILMYITSSIIGLFAPFLLVSMMTTRFYKPISKQVANLFLSSVYALFLPLMSYLLSQEQQNNPEGKAYVILTWMVLTEIIRILGNPISTWELRKSAQQLVRLLWVGFLVYRYTPLQGIRVSLLVLCIYIAVVEVRKGIIFYKAKNSHLIGWNPNLIHNYVKRIMLQDDLQTTPMNSCDYIIMGEENYEVAVGSNGYFLGKKKSNAEDMLTIGRIFQPNLYKSCSVENPYWRDTGLSIALAKMLRCRFVKLPVAEAGCKKALDFILQGVIGYIGRIQDIQTARNERSATERVFGIIQEELKFISAFPYIGVPTYNYLYWNVVNMIGGVIVMCNEIYLVFTITYKISKRNSSLPSLLAQEAYNLRFLHFLRRGSEELDIMSCLDLGITMCLVSMCMCMQMVLLSQDRCKLTNFYLLISYIKDPASNTPLSPSEKNYLYQLLPRPQIKDVNKTRVYPSVLDAEAETTLFCIKIDQSILARLPKWPRRKIPRSFPTVIHSTDAKEGILRSLKKSGGRLTNGETSLQKYKMEHLILGFCQPNGSTTEAILVWHIATTLLHHQESSPQQNNNSHQEFAPQENNSPYKDQEVALGLSSYCHYLVKFLRELLPDDLEWTEEIYENVKNEILDIALFFDQKPTKKDRCDYTLQAMWVECSVVGKGVMLAKDLIKCAEDGKHVWEMLAEFWAEIMLFISPSDNVDGHEKILDREELITQIWALLTHAGIVTRPKPTNHLCHPTDRRDGAHMRTMLGEFWADMMLLIASSNNMQGHEENLQRGDALITKLRALLSHAGIVTRPKPTNHQYHPSESRDGAQMRMILGEFWADMMLLIAPSNIVEGHEENLERGDTLITKLRALLSHAGIVTSPEPTEHEVHQSHRIPVTVDEIV